MGRHGILNPKTGRMVFKTGALGQKIIEKKAKTVEATNKPKCCHNKHCPNNKHSFKKKTSREKVYKIMPNPEAAYNSAHWNPINVNGKHYKLIRDDQGEIHWAVMKKH